MYAAQVYTILGKLETADSLLHRAVELDGSFINGYFGLGNLNMMKRNYRVAEENYKKVLNLNPAFSLAYFNLAIMYSTTDPAEAKRNLEKTIGLSPKFAHAYYVLGYLEMQQGKNNAALHNWTRAVELDPQNILYNVVLGLININTSNQDDGFNEIIKVMGNPQIRSFIEVFQKMFNDKHASDFLYLALTYYENSGSLTYNENQELRKALCYFYQGKYSAADRIFKEQAGISSSPGLIFYLQGFNYEYFQKPELSLISYNASIKQSAFPSEAYLRQGIIFHLQGKFREAIKPLSLYTVINDSSKVAFLLKGSAFLNISEFDSAICSFNNFLKLDSNQLDGYFNRACCFKQKEMYMEAGNDFDHVIRYRIFDLESIELLAECKYSSGDTTGALTLLDESFLKFHVLNENGFYLRGTINLWQMQYDSAIFNFNQVVRFQNHHDDVLTMRGLAYYCKADYKNAKTDLNSAINFNPNDLTAIFTLGMVNLKLNEFDDAYFNLKKAQSLGHPLAGKSLILYLKDYKPSAKNNRK